MESSTARRENPKSAAARVRLIIPFAKELKDGCRYLYAHDPNGRGVALRCGNYSEDTRTDGRTSGRLTASFEGRKETVIGGAGDKN